MAGLLTGIGAVSTAGASDDVDSCTSHTTTIVSDGTTMTVGGVSTDLPIPHPSWTASIPGASWIWASPADAATESFMKSFTFPGTVMSAMLDIAADNTYSVSLNGNAIGSDLTPVNFDLAGQDVYAVSTAFFVSGANSLDATVSNIPIGGDLGIPHPGNPAGLLFKLVVESEVCHGDVTVKNHNSASVYNEVLSGANTGGNKAGGSTGGDGGNGGNVANSGGNQNVNYAATGMGGNGGNGSVGGTVDTGAATANASVDNDINNNHTEVDLCGCNASSTVSTSDVENGDVRVKNRNEAEVGNVVAAGADSGMNKAKGSRGGRGGSGGDIANDGGNQNVNGGVEAPTTTGNGGAGGNAGNAEVGGGGWVTTGAAKSDARAVNKINHNWTRVVR